MKSLAYLQPESHQNDVFHSPTFRMSTSVKSLGPPSAICRLAQSFYCLCLLLCEPRTRDHRKLLSQLPKELWTIRNNHNRLLHCTPRDIGRFVQKFIGVHLPGARYAKNGGGRAGTHSSSTEGEVGEILGGSSSCSAFVREPFGCAPYAWAPSERAMKGRNDQSFSAAGSAPSPTPNQLSISGPLAAVSLWCDSLHG